MAPPHPQPCTPADITGLCRRIAARSPAVSGMGGDRDATARAVAVLISGGLVAAPDLAPALLGELRRLARPRSPQRAAASCPPTCDRSTP
jgi:hypothetical protein